MEKAINRFYWNPQGVLSHTFGFMTRYAFPILILSLIAAIGRAIQVGWSGHISEWAHLGLEIAVESARVALFVLIVIKGLQQETWRNLISQTSRDMKENWHSILLDFIWFCLIAFVINLILWNVSELEVIHRMIVSLGVPNTEPGSLTWVALLFFKNMSVIPFTIIFMGFMSLILYYGMKKTPLKAQKTMPKQKV